MIVVDTNVIAYWLIDGTRTASARIAHELDSHWRVPPLWRAELLNVLATSVRTDVLGPDQAGALWTTAVALLIGTEVEPSGNTVLEVALRDRISAYDAQFVVVAEQLGCSLVTADARLASRSNVAVMLDAFVAPR